MGTSSSTNRRSRTYYDHRVQTQRNQDRRYTSATDVTDTATGSGGGGDNYVDVWEPHRSTVSTSVREVHAPPPAYVEHKEAKKIKNDVNVHKDSVRVVVDDFNPDTLLVSFSFDALVDGCFTIFYFAKEGPNCTFTPIYPETYMPRLVSFKKGLGQKFCQPPGTGIDLGFFELNQLSKPSPDETIFPLVIQAETGLPGVDSELLHYNHRPVPNNSPHAQITQAVLQKNDEGMFRVGVVKQILWIDGVRYELREIYGIRSSDEAGGIDENDDDDLSTECVICMSKPKNTACLPCRHMCLCVDCAKDMRVQSNKCPICRQPIQQLMEIKIHSG